MVMTPAAIREVFGIECCVIRHPLGDVPVCLPNGFCAMLDPARHAGGQPVSSNPDPPPPVT
jgi:ferric citrate transport system ATP-binding protein